MDFVDPDSRLFAGHAIIVRPKGANGLVSWNLRNPVSTTEMAQVSFRSNPQPEGCLGGSFAAARSVYSFSYATTNGFSYSYKGTPRR